ncbi:MAG: ferritin-like domain-containing protein [Bacteroidota bacterium]|nr:ferritin-like domain-containing protein [Bacteroidota bacterium]
MKSSQSGSAAKGKKTPAKASKSNGSPSSNGDSQFEKLFEDGLKDMYWVEKTLTKAIPKMISNATSDELIAALEEHLTVTEEQVKKVERVFEVLGKKPEAKPCAAMKGILEEGEETMKEFQGMTGDAGIIYAAQKVEHYEIASYGTLCAFANTLGMTDAAEILQEILDEEKDADSTLTQIAESSVNMEAIAEGNDEEEE